MTTHGAKGAQRRRLKRHPMPTSPTPVGGDRIVVRPNVEEDGYRYPWPFTATLVGADDRGEVNIDHADGDTAVEAVAELRAQSSRARQAGVSS